MKRDILVGIVGLGLGVGLISCGGYRRGNPSGLVTRVLASQGVTATFSFGSLITVDGKNDTMARVAPLGAGNSPGLMVISPTRNIVAAFDAGTNSVFAVDTTKETNLGHVQLRGPSSSIVVPAASPIAYAAVPTDRIDGYSFLGGVDVLNLSVGAITTTIAVTNAQTVIANGAGSQLLVLSNDSDNVTVLYPGNAVPPVDLSCVTSPPNPVCTIVQDPQLSRPVYALVSGSSAYILNCGFECGGSQPANVAVFDLGSLTVTGTIPVDAATMAFLSGSTLYVAGTPPGNPCPSTQNTAAATCGELDIVDLNSMQVTSSVAITDGYHNHMDMSVNGQLFIGSRDCTEIGNVNNPNGEVRGCLTIFNTKTNSIVIPPDNGNVNGLQSFVSRNVEYVAEGGYLRVYDTTKDVLLKNNFIPAGTLPIVGYVGDVKAIDFF